MSACLLRNNYGGRLLRFLLVLSPFVWIKYSISISRVDWTVVSGRCYYLSALNSCITNLIHHFCRLYCNTLSQFFSNAFLYFLNIGRLQCFRVQFAYRFCSLSFTRRKLKKNRRTLYLFSNIFWKFYKQRKELPTTFSFCSRVCVDLVAPKKGKILNASRSFRTHTEGLFKEVKNM